MAHLENAGSPRQPFFLAPAPVVWLIAALVIAHGLRMLAPGALSDQILVNYAFVPVRYAADVLAARGIGAGSLFEQAVPFVSYIFLHADLTHLAVNSLWLLAFGPPVARRLGTPAFLAFFFLCGIVAIATHLFANWGSLIPVVGASGAVAGLMGAGIRVLYRNRRLVFGERPALASALAPRVMLFSGIWIVVNVAAGLTGLGTTSDMALIAWEAHLGGYFAGLLLIGPFDALFPRRNAHLGA